MSRLVLMHTECRHCGASTREMHPSGVVVEGNWYCTRCRRWQDEPHREDAREDDGAGPA